MTWWDGFITGFLIGGIVFAIITGLLFSIALEGWRGHRSEKNEPKKENLNND